MSPSRPDASSSPSSRNHSSIGGEPQPLRVILETEISNGARRWRVSAGFLLQAALLAFVLLLPLLYTEPLTATAPRDIIVVPVQKGEPQGTVRATGGGGQTRRQIPILDDLSVRLRFPLNRIESASVEPGPAIGPGAGPGGPPLGIPGGAEGGVPGWGLPADGQPPAPDEPIRVGGRIRAPRLLRQVQPDYPTLAQRAGLEGRVVVEALLGADGRVRRVSVVAGHPLLARAAVQAVERWLYEPTYLNEQSVPVLLQVVVEFRLQR